MIIFSFPSALIAWILSSPSGLWHSSLSELNRLRTFYLPYLGRVLCFLSPRLSGQIFPLAGSIFSLSPVKGNVRIIAHARITLHSFACNYGFVLFSPKRTFLILRLFLSAFLAQPFPPAGSNSFFLFSLLLEHFEFLPLESNYFFWFYISTRMLIR